MKIWNEYWWKIWILLNLRFFLLLLCHRTFSSATCWVCAVIQWSLLLFTTTRVCLHTTSTLSSQKVSFGLKVIFFVYLLNEWNVSRKIVRPKRNTHARAQGCTIVNLNLNFYFFCCSPQVSTQWIIIVRIPGKHFRLFTFFLVLSIVTS